MVEKREMSEAKAKAEARCEILSDLSTTFS